MTLRLCLFYTYVLTAKLKHIMVSQGTLYVIQVPLETADSGVQYISLTDTLIT